LARVSGFRFTFHLSACDARARQAQVTEDLLDHNLTFDKGNYPNAPWHLWHVTGNGFLALDGPMKIELHHGRLGPFEIGG